MLTWILHLFNDYTVYNGACAFLLFYKNMQFQKTTIPTPRKVIGNSVGEGEGASKAKLFKGKYEAKLEFLGGEGVQTKKPSVVEVWIYSGTTQ